jgi:hypothetical protein
MAHSLARLGIVATGIALLAGAGCWDSGPARVVAPAIDSAAGSKAMQEFDANKDGVLDATELEKCPGLKAALSKIDTKGDGKITADEINARIKAWKDLKIGRMRITCRVMHNGQPLAGATVVFEPEKFLGDQLKPATGTTDAAGTVSPDAPYEGGVKGGIAPGFYRVKITKSGEDIPAKYNTETILGQEAAPDAANFRGIKFDLEY